MDKFTYGASKPASASFSRGLKMDVLTDVRRVASDRRQFRPKWDCALSDIPQKSEERL